MRLSDVLTEDNIITEITARDKTAALAEMVMEVVSRTRGLDGHKALEAILDREKLGTTGIGHGVAIPHGKMKGLGDIKVYFGRSRHGVDFNSTDKMPVHLIFLIIAPENAAAAYLKVLAGISHLLKSLDFRSSLLKAGSRSEIFRIIADTDRKNVTL